MKEEGMRGLTDLEIDALRTAVGEIDGMLISDEATLDVHAGLVARGLLVEFDRGEWESDDIDPINFEMKTTEWRPTDLGRLALRLVRLDGSS